MLFSLRCYKSLLLATCVGLAACGGDSSDDNASSVRTGQFVDDLVVGLHYQTGTQQGETDQNGQFHFIEGETISFYIGDLLLGSTTAKDVVTPLDLVPESKRFVDSLEVSNILRLLQTLDADSADEVIELNDTVHHAFTDISYDLTQPFDASLEQRLTQIMLQQTAGAQQIVNAKAAQTHFVQTLQNLPTKLAYDFDSDGDAVGDLVDPYPFHWDRIHGQADNATFTSSTSGFVPFQGEPSKFEQIWQDDDLDWSPTWSSHVSLFAIKAYAEEQIFAMDGYVLKAYQIATGSVAWTYDLFQYGNLYAVEYSDQRLYVLCRDDYHQDMHLLIFDAKSGDVITDHTFDMGWHTLRMTVMQGTIFIASGEGGVTALDAQSLEQKWRLQLSYEQLISMSVVGQHVLLQVEKSNGSDQYLAIEIIDAENGNRLAATDGVLVEQQDAFYYLPHPIICDAEQALLTQRGSIYSYAYKQMPLLSELGQPTWHLSVEDIVDSAMDGQFVYILQSQQLQVRDRETAELKNILAVEAQQILVDLKYIWLLGSTGIQVHDKGSLDPVWNYSIDDPRFMDIVNGVLYVTHYTDDRFDADKMLTAIDVIGDLNGNGLPDLWESSFSLALDADQDQDGDGLLPYVEFLNHTDPFNVDTDADGLPDNLEINEYHTSPVLADSDQDGLSDYDEVAQFSSNPMASDSDGDGLADLLEIKYHLQPLDASDAGADWDQDGFSNLHEILANTDINNAASLPDVTFWYQVYGNANRQRSQPIMLDTTRFSEYWNVPIKFDWHSLITGDGFVYGVSKGVLYALSSETGNVMWQYAEAQTILSNPVLFDGKVYCYVLVDDAPVLLAFNAQTGQVVLNVVQASNSNNYVYNYSISAFDGRIYVTTQEALLRLDSETGQVLWRRQIASGSYPAINKDGLFFAADDAILWLDLESGITLETFEINGISPEQTPIVLSSGAVLVCDDSQVMSVDYHTGDIRWRSDVPYIRVSPSFVAANGLVFVISEGTQLYALEEETGEVRWSWRSPSSYVDLSPDMIVTATHLFVKDNYHGIYALDLNTHDIDWSSDERGEIVMSPMLLYISTNTQLTAVDLGIDLDNDGLSDLWEQRYGADLLPEKDDDHDLLTNLQEFELGLDPSVADMDQDGLLDGEEVLTFKTSPTAADSDGDQLSDQYELQVSLTDPNQADSDQDGFKDGLEVSLLGANPNNSTSFPEPIDFWRNTFEGDSLEEIVAIPLNRKDTDWYLVSEDVSHQQSLGVSVKAKATSAQLTFEHYFQPGELSFDLLLKVAGESAFSWVSWSVHVDGEVALSAPTTDIEKGYEQWTTQVVFVPEGVHTIEWFFYSSDGAIVLLDNLEFRASALSSDLDGDGMTELWERLHGGDLLPNEDSDGDNLSNIEEFVAQTDPHAKDSDKDGWSDDVELYQYGTLPNNPDTDLDGINDSDESLYFTDPIDVDSDDDGFVDGLEVQQQTDPNDAQSFPEGFIGESFEFGGEFAMGWYTPDDSAAAWFFDDSKVSSGKRSLRSGLITDNQTSAVAWEMETPAGRLLFDYFLDSDDYCDILSVKVDDQPAQLYEESARQWISVGIVLTEGHHVIEWRYIKDNGLSRGLDAVWLDNIRFENNVTD